MALGDEEEILDGNEGTGRNYRNMETEEMATRPHGCLPHSIGAEFTKQLWLPWKTKTKRSTVHDGQSTPHSDSFQSTY